jgi:hypothetical protein
VETSLGLMGLAVPRARPARHERGISVVLGPPPRPGGPTRPDTEVHRGCVVPGRLGPGQIGLGPGSLDLPLPRAILLTGFVYLCYA